MTPPRSAGSPRRSCQRWTAWQVWSTRCASGASSRSQRARGSWSDVAGGTPRSTRPRANSTLPVLVRLRNRPSRLLATPRVEVALLRHHHLAPEDAHDLAVLVVAD